MHKANGIELSDAEFDMLRSLVESDDPPSCYESMRSADSDGTTELARSLHRMGLVSGFAHWGGFELDGITQAGKSFVHDVEASKLEAKAAERSRRRHDYRVTLAGAIAGGLFGLFSGAFSGWLFMLLQSTPR